MRAERDRRATILTAEGVKQSQILTAEGEKQAAILRAEGNAQAAILNAEGEARAILQVFDAVHRGDADPKLLAYQYLQTLPKIAAYPSNKMWFLPSELTSALGTFAKGFGGPVARRATAAGRPGTSPLGDDLPPTTLTDPAEALAEARRESAAATADATSSGTLSGTPFDPARRARPAAGRGAVPPRRRPTPPPPERPTSDRGAGPARPVLARRTCSLSSEQRSGVSAHSVTCRRMDDQSPPAKGRAAPLPPGRAPRRDPARRPARCSSSAARASPRASSPRPPASPRARCSGCSPTR